MADQQQQQQQGYLETGLKLFKDKAQDLYTGAGQLGDVLYQNIGKGSNAIYNGVKGFGSYMGEKYITTPASYFGKAFQSVGSAKQGLHQISKGLDQMGNGGAMGFLWDGPGDILGGVGKVAAGLPGTSGNLLQGTLGFLPLAATVGGLAYGHKLYNTSQVATRFRTNPSPYAGWQLTKALASKSKDFIKDNYQNRQNYYSSIKQKAKNLYSSAQQYTKSHRQLASSGYNMIKNKGGQLWGNVRNKQLQNRLDVKRGIQIDVQNSNKDTSISIAPRGNQTKPGIILNVDNRQFPTQKQASSALRKIDD